LFRGVRGVEGFPEKRRFDPDRLGQQTVSTAVNGRAGQLLLEVPDSLGSGVVVVVHAVRLSAARSGPIDHPAIASSYAVPRTAFQDCQRRSAIMPDQWSDARN
jgi:hypothetical protein